MGARGAPVKKPYHHGNLREELVKAALEIITRDGRTALTLRSVAKRLGVSQTAPYRHFASKEALLAAVATQGFDALLSRVKEGVEAAGSQPIARFCSISATYVTFALEHPAHFAVMYQARPAAFNEGPVAGRGRTAFKVLIDLIVACQRAGLASSGDPSRIAVEVWSFVHGTITLYQNGLLPRSLDDDELRRLVAHSTLFLRRPAAASSGIDSPPASLRRARRRTAS